MTPQRATDLGDDIVAFQPWTSDHVPTREIGQMAMEVISVWSRIDTAFIRMTAYFVRSDDPRRVARELIEATGRRVRDDRIHTSAKSALSTDDFDLFDKTVSAISGSRKQRDRYAHHIWMITAQRPDRMYLLNPIDLIESDLDIHDTNKGPETALGHDLLSERGGKAWTATVHRHFVFKYTKAAVRRHRRSARHALELVLDLERALLRYPTPREGAKARRTLSTALGI